MPFIAANGTITVTVPRNQKIQISSLGAGSAIISYGTAPVQSFETFYEVDRIDNAVKTYGTFPADRSVRIEAGSTTQVEYVIGASPVVSESPFNPNAPIYISPTQSTALTTLTNPNYVATNSVNNYTQDSVQNKSAGTSASSDFIAYPDNVTTDLTGFADMGMTSSGFTDAAYAVTVANDAYLFGSAPSGAGKQGNLVIATDSTGSRNDIRFCTNGFNSLANTRMIVRKEGAVNFVPLAADPANPLKGDMYFNSVANKMKIYNGTAWETITSA